MTKGTVRYLSPETLHRNPAYSNVVVTEGSCKTIYIGGQNAVDQNGSIVGDDIATQAEQVLKNIQRALAAVDAKPDHIVKWNIYVVPGVSIQDGYAAFQKVWGPLLNPPVITVVVVAALGNPAFLMEMEAVAVVPTE